MQSGADIPRSVYDGFVYLIILHSVVNSKRPSFCAYLMPSSGDAANDAPNQEVQFSPHFPQFPHLTESDNKIGGETIEAAAAFLGLK
jgi:hypothetical protein